MGALLAASSTITGTITGAVTRPAIPAPFARPLPDPVHRPVWLRLGCRLGDWRSSNGLGRAEGRDRRLGFKTGSGDGGLSRAMPLAGVQDLAPGRYAVFATAFVAAIAAICPRLAITGATLRHWPFAATAHWGPVAA